MLQIKSGDNKSANSQISNFSQVFAIIFVTIVLVGLFFKILFF